MCGPSGPGNSEGQSSTAVEEDLLDQMKDGGLAGAGVFCCRNRASHLWFSWSPVSVTVLLQPLSAVISGVCPPCLAHMCVNTLHTEDKVHMKSM